MQDENLDNPQSENEGVETEDATKEETPTDDDKDYKELYQNQKIRAEKAEARLKELPKTEETPAVETPKKDLSQSDELTDGQKALLVAYGVKGKEEIQLAKEWMGRTGDDIDTTVSDDIFQARLGKLREAKASADATPKGTRRSAPAKNDVEYWKGKIDSGQATLADIENFDVRRQVLNARLEGERHNQKFMPLK